MKALVIYESLFGNTQAIAEAIADGVSSRMETNLLEVGAAPKVVPDDVTLLVLGAPTHQFGMSRPSSREQAARETTRRPIATEIGVREWLDAVPEGSNVIPAATFCTVLEKPRLVRYVGTAGRSIEKRLRRLGYRVVAPPENFWVAGTTGPLLPGEVERARQWGAEIANRVAADALQRVQT